MSKLEDNECGVCGCYCFGSPPYKWEFIGDLKVCRGCFKRYSSSGMISVTGNTTDGAGITDPARDYRKRAILDEMSTHEARIEELQAELDALDTTDQ